MRIAMSRRRRVGFRRMRHVADRGFADRGFASSWLPGKPNPSAASILFETWVPEEPAIENSPRSVGSWEAAAVPAQVLLVEDNPNDVAPTREAFLAVDPSIQVYVASDGAEAMAFLRREGETPTPLALILSCWI